MTFRVNKTSSYTVMSNAHLREKNMTLRAKGLLSVMLSLPENWDYSIAGLAAINAESENIIKQSLDELKRFGYLVVTKLTPRQTKSGRYEYIYDIYEQPQKIQGVEKQDIEKQGVEFQGLENWGVNKYTDIRNTKEINKKKNKRRLRRLCPTSRTRVSQQSQALKTSLKSYGKYILTSKASNTPIKLMKEQESESKIQLPMSRSKPE